MKTVKHARLMAGLMAALLPAAANAIDPVDRFSASLGVYAVSHDVDLQWNGSDGIPGSRLDFARDLGFDDASTRPLWSIAGLLGHRHRLSAFGYRYESRGERVLNRNYLIGDETFPADAAFAGDMEVKHTGLAYTWLFHHGDQSAFGIGLGAIRYDVSADMAAVAVVGEQATIVEQRFSEDAWAPMLRVEYARSLSAQWRMGGELGYVRKSGDRVSGSAVDANVRIEWLPWEHFGFALRYNYNDVELDFSNTRLDADLDLRNSGPQLLATYRF